MTKIKKIAATALAAGLVLFGGISGANATPTLELWIVDTDGVVFSVDSTTGVATQVGSGNLFNGANGAGKDFTTGTNFVSNDSCDVGTVDVTSGVISATTYGQMHPATGPGYNECTAMTIDGQGNGWASVQLSDSSYHIVKWDLATGIGTALPTATATYMDLLVFNPTTGDLLGQDDNTGTIVSLDTTTGAETDTTVTTAPYAYGIVVDGDGNYWANSWDSLYKGTTGQWGSATIIGSYVNTSNVNCIFTTTNYWPAAPATTPELAKTGGEPNTLALVIGAFAVLGGLAFRFRKPVTN